MRRKLAAIGKELARRLSADDIELISRASLHHPYRFNRFRVDSQFVYLSRSPRERRQLKRILGIDLGRDLDQNYTHTLLTLEIHRHGLELALRVHKDAWWDGENLRRLLNTSAGRARFVEAVRPLEEYALRVGDHRGLHPCPALTTAELADTIRHYTPGEQWLHIFRPIARDASFVSEGGFLERLEEQFRGLLAPYRLIRWTPENNLLFGQL